jgi:hypothetical protein
LREWEKISKQTEVCEEERKEQICGVKNKKSNSN